MLTSAPPATQPRKARRFPNARAALLCAAALLLPAAAPGASQTFAQTPAQREVPASVAGRLTDGAHGLPGLAVVLMTTEGGARTRVVASAKTDAEGNYRLTNVPPGRYKISPFSPTYIVQGMNMYDYPPGKPLNLSAGESVENIDFRMERGGVITGRVTEADGNPVIGEAVGVFPADKNNQQAMERMFTDARDHSTDDRGVYRIYGLLPGIYHVSVGADGDNGAVSFGRRKLYRRTFYPDAAEEAQAKTVEVWAGVETADIDITLGRAVKTYRASGRFVNAETGQPVANISYGYGPVRADGRLAGGFGGGFTTNERGEFQTEGLTPGRYTIFASPFAMYPPDTSEFYNEPATFEVADADVTGVVVKLRTGASVSGVVVLEGVSDRAAAARLLAGVRLYGYVETPGQQTAPYSPRYASVAADGSFRIGGLHPGKLRISMSDAASKLTLARVDVNGANGIGGVDVAEGAQLTGLRVVASYGSGVIRGQVNILNGTPPPGARVYVTVRRAGASGPDAGYGRSVEADARGRFVLENVAAGEYELRANLIVFQAQPGTRPPRGESQQVSLAEGGDMNVTLNIDLGAPVKGVRQ
jgi:protocatechuate 3,4-dioxygenase beta subunit